jgi:DNA-binding Lrp family transcriptional regulator
MVLAYVLISTTPRHSYEVRDHLLKLECVQDAHVVFGQYDVIAKVNAPDTDSLGKLVFGKIRSMDTVVSTATLTVIP